MLRSPQRFFISVYPQKARFIPQSASAKKICCRKTPDPDRILRPSPPVFCNGVRPFTAALFTQYYGCSLYFRF